MNHMNNATPIPRDPPLLDRESYTRQQADIQRIIEPWRPPDEGVMPADEPPC